jgi:hypothetical protein
MRRYEITYLSANTKAISQLSSVTEDMTNSMP